MAFTQVQKEVKCETQAKLSNLELQTATPPEDCQSNTHLQERLKRVPGVYTSTILASIPSKTVESILKSRT